MKNEVAALQGTIEVNREQIMRLENLLSQEREKQFHQEQVIMGLRQRGINSASRNILGDEMYSKPEERGYQIQQSGGYYNQEDPGRVKNGKGSERSSRGEIRHNTQTMAKNQGYNPNFIEDTISNRKQGPFGLNNPSFNLEERLRNIQDEFDKLIPNANNERK